MFPKWNVTTSQHKNSQRIQDPQKQALVVGSPIRLLLCTDCESLAKIQSSYQKLFNLCPQTDTQLSSLQVGTKIFTHGNLCLFTSLRSFVCFVHSFTPFVKDNFCEGTNLASTFAQAEALQTYTKWPQSICNTTSGKRHRFSIFGLFIRALLLHSSFFNQTFSCLILLNRRGQLYT